MRTPEQVQEIVRLLLEEYPLADCTLGVYLIHPLMINLLEILGIAVTPQAPVSSLLVLLAVLAVSCFALVFVTKRIPIVRKLL